MREQQRRLESRRGQLTSSAFPKGFDFSNEKKVKKKGKKRFCPLGKLSLALSRVATGSDSLAFLQRLLLAIVLTVSFATFELRLPPPSPPHAYPPPLPHI